MLAFFHLFGVVPGLYNMAPFQGFFCIAFCPIQNAFYKIAGGAMLAFFRVLRLLEVNYAPYEGKP